MPECQSPIFVTAEVDGEGADAPVRLWFSAPPEAPTTRGFAGILAEGLEGPDAPARWSRCPTTCPTGSALAEAVSLLRLRGMAGMLGRIKRQVREKATL